MMVILNFHSYLASITLIISAIDIVVVILVGSLHTRNLVVLISDLKTINVSSEKEFKSVQCERVVYNIFTLLWVFSSLTAICFIFFIGLYQLGILLMGSMDILLCIHLFVLNFRLNR